MELKSREKKTIGLMGIRGLNEIQGVSSWPGPSMERKVLTCLCNCVFSECIYILSDVLLSSANI